MNQSLLSHKLITANLAVISQLTDALYQLDDLRLTTRPKGEDKGTIGMHFRHVIEFYQELIRTMKADSVEQLCYDKRKRNLELETSSEGSIRVLEEIAINIQTYTSEDKPLIMQSVLTAGQPMVEFPTTFYRELHYVMEHAVHHMAIIKMLAEQMGISLDSNFGIAAATQDYRQKTA